MFHAAREPKLPPGVSPPSATRRHRATCAVPRPNSSINTKLSEETLLRMCDASCGGRVTGRLQAPGNLETETWKTEGFRPKRMNETWKLSGKAGGKP